MTNTVDRSDHLRQTLNERRRELLDEVQSRLRDGRTGGSKDVRDAGEDSDDLHQRDIGFSVLQMQADNLTRIDEALARLDAGQYGNCVECQARIAESRLRALPFAVRCRPCEARREQATLRARQLGGQLESAEVLVRAGRRPIGSGA